jgi:hypothetical protein
MPLLEGKDELEILNILINNCITFKKEYDFKSPKIFHMLCYKVLLV